MGLSLNPVEYRLGYTRSWEDSWFLNNNFYPVFLHRILLLKSLINYLMYYGVYPNRELSWVFSHSEFILFNNRIFVNIYLYDTVLSGIFFGQMNDLKRSLFKSIRLPSFWMKNNLLNRRYRAQRLVKIMGMMNINVSNQVMDVWKYRWYDSEILKLMQKLHRLRKRYGANWLGKEEIFFWNVLFHLYEKERKNSFFFLRWLYQFFRLFYSKLILKFRLKRKLINKVDFQMLSVIRANLYKVYFFLLFFTRLLKLLVFFPIQKSDKKIISFVLKVYYAWFFQRPIFEQFKNYIEWFLMYFRLDVKVGIYAVVNMNLSAMFFARFIAEAIQLEFKLRDLISLLHVYLMRSMRKKRIVIYNPWKFEKAKFFLKKIRRFSNRLNHYKNFVFLSKMALNKLFSFIKLKNLMENNFIIFFFKYKLKKILNYNNYLLFYKSNNCYFDQKFILYFWLKIILRKIYFFFVSKKIRRKKFKFLKKQNINKFLYKLSYNNLDNKVNYFITLLKEIFDVKKYLYCYYYLFFNTFLMSNNFFFYLFNYIKNIQQKVLNFKIVNKLYDKYKKLDNKLFTEAGLINLEGLRKKKKTKFFLKTQLSRLKIINNLESLFFGYKLHFVGRFSRKQRSSNFWFWEGGVPSSNISMNVDYGAFSINLDNSRCTVKVWLYRNKITPVRHTKF